MMGQSRNRSTKRYVEQWFNGRLVRGNYVCSACLTKVQKEDNFCRKCGLDIREVKGDTERQGQ